MNCNDYENTIREQITAWESQIEVLRVQLTRTGNGVHARLQEEFDGLERFKTHLLHKLCDLRNAGETGWERAVHAVDEACHEFALALERYAIRFRVDGYPKSSAGTRRSESVQHV